MNCQDFAENGLSLADSIVAAGLLSDAGLDSHRTERRAVDRKKAVSEPAQI